MSHIRAALAVLFLSMFPIPALAVELVMVEEPGCPWCAKWETELGAIYPKTSEGQFAPLRKVQLHDLRQDDGSESLGIAVKRPVLFTPTFLLLEDGAELARIEGYPGEDFFWGLLEVMLIENTAFTPADELPRIPAPALVTN